MIIEPATVEFLDAYCTIRRYSSLWSIIQVEGFGNYAYQSDEETKVLEKVENLKLWEEEKEVYLVIHAEGRYKVRNVCGTKVKIKNDKVLYVQFYVNMSIPRKNVVDLRNIKYDAYNNLDVALQDANEEAKDNSVVVFTKEINTKVDLQDKPVLVGHKNGLVYDIESVEKVIQENEYLWMVIANILNSLGDDKKKFDKLMNCIINKKITPAAMDIIRSEFKKAVTKENGQ